MQQVTKNGRSFWWVSLRYALLGGFAVAVGLVLKNPVAFRQWVSIKEAAQVDPLSTREGAALDIEELIGSIPYQDRSNFEVEPSRRYRQALVEGVGDCSNFAFGLAYKLLEEQQDFRLIFFLKLPLARNAAYGHTVIQTDLIFDGKVYNGIVDLKERGLPLRDGKPIRLQQLRNGFEGIEVRTLVDYASVGSYYSRSEEEVVLGVLTSRDIGMYFDFLAAVHVPLGNARFEQYIYEGLALLLGRYPRIQVDPLQFRVIMAQEGGWRFAALALLWSVRLAPLLGMGWLFWSIRSAARRAVAPERILEVRNRIAA